MQPAARNTYFARVEISDPTRSFTVRVKAENARAALHRCRRQMEAAAWHRGRELESFTVTIRTAPAGTATP